MRACALDTVTFAGSGLRTSRLAYGLSRLHHVPSSADRQGLLSVAESLGFRHFDTAPLYGDGLAERELGRFLRGKRDRFIVATKAGLPPNPIADAFPPLRLPIQVSSAVLRRLRLSSPRLPDITAAEVRRSVRASLRRLGTDYVDLLLLHEPSIARIPDIDGLSRELENLKQQGLIRYYGLAGRCDDIQRFIHDRPELCEVLQTDEAGCSSLSRVPDVTYSVLSQGAQSVFAAKPPRDQIAARLRAALARRPNGTVIVSSTRPGNLRELADLARPI